MVSHKSPDTSVMELLYEALHSKLGVSLAVSDAPGALSKLSKFRQDAGDPELQQLSFSRSPFMPEEEVWIIKKQSALPAPAIKE